MAFSKLHQKYLLEEEIEIVLEREFNFLNRLLCSWLSRV